MAVSGSDNLIAFPNRLETVSDKIQIHTDSSPLKVADTSSPHSDNTAGDIASCSLPRKPLQPTGLLRLASLVGAILAASMVAGLSGQALAVPGDIDNDTIADEIDLDADNDAIPNIFEGTGDDDNDGLPNFLDLDSDNDTIPDIVESILNRELLLSLDSNGDGLVDAGVPLGDNGLADAVEILLDSENIIFELPDSDRDGVENFRDLDSDNDGLSDRIELRNLNQFVFPSIENIIDGNRNGIDDTVGVVNVFFDADGDGAENAYDLDSDNDQLSDLLETSGLEADRDNNGQIDQFIDLDGNGLDDSLQNAPLQISDLDNDGLPNHLDLDSDNDGLLDNEEFQQNLPVTTQTTLTSPPSLIPELVANDDTTADANQPVNILNPTVVTSGINGSAIGGCSIQHATLGTRSSVYGAVEWLLLLLPILLLKIRRSPIKLARLPIRVS